ncbi:MAG TPA: acyl-CoA dehydrogenase family protein [Myxococcota bacterium]|nr:acyl-CoA dehydrogenase family protein [Myxococcota bacterium]
MADLEAFRSDLQRFLAQNAPDAVRGLVVSAEGDGNWGGRKATYDPLEMKRWLEVMASRGFTAPTWPKEYGGGGLSPEEAKVLRQELAAQRLPPPLIGFGLEMIGPTLLRYGTEAQKRQHIPAIARGEIRWCQGYSEPDSGSDLASLATRAVRRGDHFVVTGTKVWTSYGDLSDWIFALVRTNPNAKKQEGITFLLIDMATPGVSVRPIKLISGKSPFCETRFDEVRVPVANVLGEIDGGWSVAKALLGFERNMIADTFGTVGSARSERRGSRLANLARDHGLGASDALGDAVVRDEIARCEMDERAFALTVQRSRDAARAGHQPGPESSIFKLYGTELNKRRTELSVRIAGPQGLGWEGPGFDDDELLLTRHWLRARGNSIEGGTSEVQLNIIAKRVLGLPD